jgi:hypothetical protein
MYGIGFATMVALPSEVALSHDSTEGPDPVIAPDALSAGADSVLRGPLRKAIRSSKAQHGSG